MLTFTSPLITKQTNLESHNTPPIFTSTDDLCVYVCSKTKAPMQNGKLCWIISFKLALLFWAFLLLGERVTEYLVQRRESDGRGEMRRQADWRQADRLRQL